MDKNMLAAIGVTIALLGGGLFFLQANSEDTETTKTTQSEQQTEQTSEKEESRLGANPLGLDEESSKGPYKITITTTGPNGDSSTIVFVDDKENIESTVNQNGQETMFIAFEDSVYLQAANEGWVRIPSGSNSPLSADELNSGFDISSQDNLREAEEAGTGDCSAGTCRIYEIIDRDGSRGTVKVDQQTNRLSDIEIETVTDEIVAMVYDYSVAVQVSPPDDFSEFNLELNL